jgi:hypothetical protein
MKAPAECVRQERGSAGALEQRNKLIDATRYLARRADYNNLFGVYICLLKSDEWAYEKEWRITAWIDYCERPNANAETNIGYIGRACSP